MSRGTMGAEVTIWVSPSCAIICARRLAQAAASSSKGGGGGRGAAGGWRCTGHRRSSVAESRCMVSQVICEHER